jgi:lysophospholipase L1-like esterase
MNSRHRSPTLPAVKKTLRQIAIALVATLLFLEVALQLASLLAGPLLRGSSAGARSEDEIVILCVGDSHTYGAPLPQEEAYPAQLWGLLEEQYPSAKFRVINMGVPGVNTAYVASRLERQIVEIRPDLVMASGGLNNLWNDLWGESREASESVWNPLRRALLNVKLFRLAAVATSKVKFEPPKDERGRWSSSDRQETRSGINRRLYSKTTPGVASLEIEKDQVMRGIEHDMKWMANTAHAYDTPIIWYNYPGLTPKVKDVQATIEATGAALGIPVVRTSDDLASALAAGYRIEQLSVFAAGPHPTAILYSFIVRSMQPEVVRMLKEWHGIELGPPESPTAP